MSAIPQSRRPSRRSFGVDPSPNNTGNTRRPSGRVSFSNNRRPSFPRRMGPSTLDEQVLTEEPVERPPIPNAFEQGEEHTTPLPVLSMIVLSITMLGEFLSANVSTPFILFMVRGFGELEDEAQVAFWTGVIVSSFFLTQFLTSLLWATVAEKYGRRLVLSTSLLGSALACIIFGTATSIQQAIVIRLLQGVFAGAVGVARGSVGFMTDTTNEGRAYAILGFCWGLGGVAGAIIGGSFERPADKWPGVFTNLKIFVTYPYLLPCLLAALITGTGSFLSLFLDREGGPREGAIRLLPEKENRLPSPIAEEGESLQSSSIFGDEVHHEPQSVVGTLRKKFSGPLQKKFSGYLSNRTTSNAHSPGSVTPLPSDQPAVPLAINNNRFNGSAYGYTGGYRSRIASNAGFSLRRPSAASSARHRRGSNYNERDATGPSSFNEMNFAQRLLMANENAVTNIADLWVASAMNADNENPFESDTDEDDNENVISDNEDLEEDTRQEDLTSSTLPPRKFSATSGHPRPSIKLGSGRPPNLGLSMLRPQSTRHSSFSSTMPSIFAHPGVKTPPAVLNSQQPILETQTPYSQDDTLRPIPETGGADSEQGSVLGEKKPSIMSVIPVMVIIQYGMLALHSTTHDQVFVSYLVSDYEAGGLNLNAGHFAQLIAMMCFAQIAYQFYLYPNVGPPRGRFSHLTMFRFGSLLFIPSYLTVVLYRPFASAEDDGNFILMTALVLSTALRYCAITFSYTSISILLNYMTPPHAVGIANGIAQSMVSLTRFFGPILGGWLWSASVEGNPSGYPFGFVVCAAVCGVGVAGSFLIR